jgi:hypothetical protein
MRRSQILWLFPTSLLMAIACGTTDDSVFPNGGGGADGGLTDGDLNGDVLFADDAAAACPSQILCGAKAACCQQGEECIEGACLAACQSGVRCGANCCAGGQLCLNAACIAPGAACQDSFDCADNEFCEPTVGKCLPQPTGENVCVLKPPTPTFAPVVKWSWTGSTIKPDYDQVINMPVVIDLDGNKFPEVVIVTSGNADPFNATDKAFVRVLDGRDGTEKWPATVDAYKEGGGSEPDYTVNPRGTPAAADLDGNGTIEIVVPRRGGGLYAFNANGGLLWRSKRQNGNADYNGAFESVAVAIADMDADGKAEIIAGGVVFDYTGKLVTDTSIGRERWGANDSGYGAVSIVADVDGNPALQRQYVLTGNRAIRKDGTFLWDQSATLSDGYTAIADLDKDGVPELVVTYSVPVTGGRDAYIRVQNGVTGALIGSPLKVPGEGRGGPPTIADFDGDSFMEIASANGTAYNVFEFDVGTKALSVKWSKTTQDGSSNVTGSSVFDFEGDGAAEVLYNDECYSRVYKGTNGDPLLVIPNSTGTIHEYPIVADVNGDNRSEFVVVANDRNHKMAGLTCPSLDGAPPGVRHGVFVYGDPNNKWVRTRRIWNQHAYHITNIDSDGKVPTVEPLSWGPQGLNNYRVSSQGRGVFNAPDLAVDLEISTQPCPAGIELRARVKNGGSLGVPAGVAVTFYGGTNAQAPVIGQGLTTRALLPGESEVVKLTVPAKDSAQAYFVTVDGASVDAGSANGIVQECLEGNNSGSAGGIRCPTVK